MSYDLATIRTDAPIEFTPEANLRREPDRAALYQLFLRLEFAKLIDKYGLTAPQGEGDTETAPVTGTCESEVVESGERMEELLALWRGAGPGGCAGSARAGHRVRGVAGE